MLKSLIHHYNLLSIWLSLWLTLAHSGSLWLSLAYSDSLSGSLRRSLAHRVLARLPTSWTRNHSLSQPVWRVKFSGQKLCIECKMWLTLHGVVSFSRSLRLILCWLAFMLMIQGQNFAVWHFGGSNEGVFRLMVVKSHFLDRNISYTQNELS